VRVIATLIVIAFAAAACSPAASETTSTTTAQSTIATTTTTTTTTIAPTTTTTSSSAATSQPSLGETTQSSIGDPLFPDLGNGGYDVKHYGLDLLWEPGSRTLTGAATIEAKALVDLDAFNLDFSGMTVERVEVDGTAAGFSLEAPELVIEPADPIAAGTTFTVAVSYHGVPQTQDSQAISFGIGWVSGPGGEEFVVAEPDGAHTWFPANDHPLDKAPFDFTIVVPDGYLAAANGEFIGTEPAHRGPAGGIAWTWSMDQPMATYLATVVIAEGWEIVDADDYGAVDIRHVLPLALADDPPPALERTPEMIEFFEELFGPYPFDEYGIAVVDGFDAALENQTLSLFDVDAVASPIFEYVLVHELAHQWFGNSVSIGHWQDIWLNEGFATYAEFLWEEHINGPAAYDDFVAARRRAVEQSNLRPPGDPPADDLFNASVYWWGGLTLAALREEVGADDFNNILRTYADERRYGNATTADFVEVSERISGLDLDEFFEAWLYGPTLPPEG